MDNESFSPIQSPAHTLSVPNDTVFVVSGLHNDGKQLTWLFKK